MTRYSSTQSIWLSRLTMMQMTENKLAFNYNLKLYNCKSINCKENCHISKKEFGVRSSFRLNISKTIITLLWLELEAKVGAKSIAITKA